MQKTRANPDYKSKELEKQRLNRPKVQATEEERESKREYKRVNKRIQRDKKRLHKEANIDIRLQLEKRIKAEQD